MYVCVFCVFPVRSVSFGREPPHIFAFSKLVALGLELVYQLLCLCGKICRLKFTMFVVSMSSFCHLYLSLAFLLGLYVTDPLAFMFTTLSLVLEDLPSPLLSLTSFNWMTGAYRAYQVGSRRAITVIYLFFNRTPFKKCVQFTHKTPPSSLGESTLALI